MTEKPAREPGSEEPKHPLAPIGTHDLVNLEARVPGAAALSGRAQWNLARTLEKHDPPPTVCRAGPLAVLAWDEFTASRNENTRRAYEGAVRRLCAWCLGKDLELRDLTASDITDFLLERYPERRQIATRNSQLAPIRRFFDQCVVRHALIQNPCSSVRCEPLSRKTGLTPEIDCVTELLTSIQGSSAAEVRDRALIALLAGTGRRIGAICALELGDFVPEGTHWKLRFLDKGNKSTEIALRADLEDHLFRYMETAGLEPGGTGPLLLSVRGKSNAYTQKALRPNAARRTLKKRLAEAGLSQHFVPHSFRVFVGTDLSKQKVPLEDIQELLGHSDARTTKLYDRSDRTVTRNLVERLRF